MELQKDSDLNLHGISFFYLFMFVVRNEYIYHGELIRVHDTSWFLFCVEFLKAMLPGEMVRWGRHQAGYHPRRSPSLAGHPIGTCEWVAKELSSLHTHWQLAVSGEPSSPAGHFDLCAVIPR